MAPMMIASVAVVLMSAAGSAMRFAQRRLEYEVGRHVARLLAERAHLCCGSDAAVVGCPGGAGPMAVARGEARSTPASAHDDLPAIRQTLLDVHADAYAEAMDDPFVQRFPWFVDYWGGSHEFACVIGYDGAEPVGFAYGAPATPGREWWREHVSRPPLADDSTFSVSELMVRPKWRKTGAAARLHAALLESRPESPRRPPGRPRPAQAAGPVRDLGIPESRRAPALPGQPALRSDAPRTTPGVGSGCRHGGPAEASWSSGTPFARLRSPSPRFLRTVGSPPLTGPGAFLTGWARAVARSRAFCGARSAPRSRTGRLRPCRTW